MFRLSGDDGALLSLLSGWDGSSNPFGSGFLRLEQNGTDTLLQWDQDGAAGGENWETLVVFENTDADDFTDANFVPGYDPDGAAPAGETITGTEDDDTLAGTVGDDTINALGGDDTVFGLAGADLIYGGDGFDNLNGEDDNDVIDGGNDDDFLSGGDGNDQLFGQAGNDILFGEDGDDQLSGGDGRQFDGDAGNDIIAGGDGDDTLDGGDGNDFLSGGSGSDVLTGGAGADIFDFQSASHGPDEITDFVSGIDTIRVSASGFGGGLIAGGTVSLVSGSDPTASGARGQFLFDTDDGRLLWDADGTGSGAAVLVATLSNVPSLAASDFVVILGPGAPAALARLPAPASLSSAQSEAVRCRSLPYPDLLARRQLDLLAIVAGAGAVDDEEIAVGVEDEQEVVPDALAVVDALVALGAEQADLGGIEIARRARRRRDRAGRSAARSSGCRAGGARTSSAPARRAAGRGTG